MTGQTDVETDGQTVPPIAKSRSSVAEREKPNTTIKRWSTNKTICNDRNHSNPGIRTFLSILELNRTMCREETAEKNDFGIFYVTGFWPFCG